MLRKLTSLPIVLGALVSTGLAAQECIDDTPEIHPRGQFVDQMDGTILDVSNGLYWSRCNLGETYNETTNSCAGTPISFNDWQSALIAAADPANTTIGEHSGFRLPNIKELQSLVDYRCISPATSIEFFPSALNAPYWSSTPDANDVNPLPGYDALMIDFKDGQEMESASAGIILVRLVKHISE